MVVTSPGNCSRWGAAQMAAAGGKVARVLGRAAAPGDGGGAGGARRPPHARDSARGPPPLPAPHARRSRSLRTRVQCRWRRRAGRGRGAEPAPPGPRGGLSLPCGRFKWPSAARQGRTATKTSCAEEEGRDKGSSRGLRPVSTELDPEPAWRVQRRQGTRSGASAQPAGSRYTRTGAGQTGSPVLPPDP